MVSVKSDDTHLLFQNPAIKWVWTPTELERFRGMWEDGADILTIAKRFKVSQLTIALMVMDQAELGEIKQRAGGLLGDK
ncbi:hypothetical protein [Sporosarcina sp. A2]|uniref:hypothetical protein n=1 Tax=Sporosarcina sp. A2 TaxID=3393449 RepID=UPI003D7926A5